MLVRSAPVPVQRAEVSAWAPLVIVVPAQVYEGAPWGFEVLAEKVASLLMLDPEPLAPIVLEYQIDGSAAVRHPPARPEPGQVGGRRGTQQGMTAILGNGSENETSREVHGVIQR